MSTSFTIIAEEFDGDLKAIRSLIDTFNVPQQSAPKVRVAAANSATLLLAATFEEFIREMARTYARAVVAATRAFNRLPRKLATTAWRNTMETLARIRIDTDTRAFSAESKISDARTQFEVVYKFCNGDLSQDIYNELIYNENNMRPGQINLLFGVSGLSDVCLQIANRMPILEIFDETEVGKAHGRLLKSLEEFFERRNDIAHSLNAARSSGPDQIFKDIDMFSAFGKSLCETLEAHLITPKTQP